MKNEWCVLKKKGNPVYKTGGTEPIDLFKEGSILWDWCIGEIIAKAYRNRSEAIGIVGNLENSKIKVASIEGVLPYLNDIRKKTNEDLDEIIHHTEMLKAVINETTRKK